MTKKKKILILEDEPDIGEIMLFTFTQAGHNAKVLLGGKNVDSNIKKFAPDLIIMDLWMPGVDGSIIAKKLKTQNSTKHIPIIMISAGNTLEKVAKRVGAQGFLSKPFDLSDLLAIAQKFLSN